jgi:hypothetical protein
MTWISIGKLALVIAISVGWSSGAPLWAQTTEYAYDARGRLIEVRQHNSDVTINRSTYTYDAANNRSQVTVVVGEQSGGGSGNGGQGCSVAIADLLNNEGDSPLVNVTRSGSCPGSFSVSYATANGTATTPTDYDAMSGILSFAPGDPPTKTFMINLPCGPAWHYPYQYFYINLSGATNGAAISDPQSVVTIREDC